MHHTVVCCMLALKNIAQLRTEIPYLHSKQGSSKGINACTHINLLKHLKLLSSSVKRYRFISKGNYPNV